MTNVQPYYYIDSNFQLELNLQELRRKLIILLDIVDNIGCLVCDKLKCCCTLDKTPDDADNTPVSLVIDNEQTNDITINENELAVEASVSPRATDTSELIIPDGPTITPLMTSSPIRFQLLPKSPPASSLPLPEWNKEKEDTSKSEFQTKYKEVDAWVKSSLPEPEKQKTIDIVKQLNASWPVMKTSLNVRRVNSPVEAFFKSYNWQVQPPKRVALTQVDLLNNSFLNKKTLFPKSSCTLYKQV